MMASAPTSHTPSYKKSLVGIQLHEGTNLLKLWVQAYKLSCSSSTKNVPSKYARSKAEEDACQVLNDAGDPGTSDNDHQRTIPIPILSAIQVVFEAQGGAGLEKLVALESSLASEKLTLAFTPPPSLEDADKVSSYSTKTPEAQRKFQRRMDRLRLQNEETRYSKLTGNIQDNRQVDDVTAKSMTYAASVGLNMIIAPLSFGCFVYFFSGGILHYVFGYSSTYGEGDGNDSSSRRHNPVDIRRVILAVISGVAMMFIEMILFVIRTHEFEEHNRKKKKKRGVEPFGVYSKNSPAVYSSPSPPPSSGKPLGVQPKASDGASQTATETRPASGRKKTTKATSLVEKKT